jgi:mannose-6-phosphate isomerase-like protein (cupin superfamily)
VELDVAHAIVLGPGEGEVVTDRPARTLHLKAGIEAIAVTESRYEPGERGPDAHIHRRHVDAFYVLEGTMLYELGPNRDVVEAPADSFIAAPPGVVHSFRNDSPSRARFLNFHAPSERFHDHLRGMYAGEDTSWFDQYDPPPDGGRPRADAVVRGPGETERLEVDGMLAFAETTAGAGAGDPPDALAVHRVLYVLDGNISLVLGDDELDAAPGTFVCVPPGVRHAVANRGTKPARLVELTVPAVPAA